MSQSTMVAAVVHVGVLIAWPRWEIPRTAVETPSELLQIDPILSYGGSTALADALPFAVSGVDDIEPAFEEQNEEGWTDENGTEPSEGFSAAVPPVVVPRILPAPTSVPIEGRANLLLEHIPTVSPVVTEVAASVSWPQIRNPRSILRFLRARYRDLSEAPGARGFVSVSLWIDEQGSVERASLKESSGLPVLDEIALVLFEQIAAFAPARNGQVTVPVHVTITVPFTVPW